MARIHIDNDDDSLPDLADLLISPRKKIQSIAKDEELPRSRSRTQAQPQSRRALDSSRRCKVEDSRQRDVLNDGKSTRRRKEDEDEKLGKPRQRVLKKVENNARLGLGLVSRSDSKEKLGLGTEGDDGDKKTLPSRTPRRLAKSRVHKVIFSDDEDEKEANKDLKEDSEYDSADSLPSPSNLFRKPRLFGAGLDKPVTSLKLGKFLLPSLPSSAAVSKDSLASKTQPIVSTTSRPTSSSDNDNAPPKRYSPSKRVPQSSRPSTPPPSPPKQSILNSPTKSKPAKIPDAPLHPDIDAFWSQDVVSDWNEQWSPKKVLASPKKSRFVTPNSDADSDAPSPSISPRKSPTKKDKSAIQAKKDFESRKHQLAEDFLQELDSKVTKGQIAELAASSGGVKIVWNKKLNSTAGRANWRRESTRTTHTDGTISRKYRHIANIELAEKVIDDEDRLINVLAHEFCHLANFMISDVKDNPHGKEFKEWAKKCSHHFGATRNVVVTTKHSYDIAYKYMWECTGCAVEYKRHSKSIDPKKHTCGVCKAPLVQTKPVPRKEGAKVSEYQVFVKENFKRVKQERVGASHGEIMEILGREYREGKGGGAGVKASGKKEFDVESVVKVFEVITLDE
ncbi:hmg box-containing protein [Venturia nashicola]|uniref:Hmg box-containing protein n=1 Tax=Venturia nashicola TaxID=86259 RepID=A0A4Z1NZ49_9PEZI|nr:hmg box-containing protein [Venturia nashicola]TLD19471.1 hmg box-containing protein [Venturia nashicola]